MQNGDSAIMSVQHMEFGEQTAGGNLTGPDQNMQGETTPQPAMSHRPVVEASTVQMLSQVAKTANRLSAVMPSGAQGFPLSMMVIYAAVWGQAHRGTAR